MPFKLQLLNQLTHHQIDEAIKYVCSKYWLVLPSSSPIYHVESTPYHRLFECITPIALSEDAFGFNLKVMAKLLGGRDYELEWLSKNPNLIVATRIFLKFKIEGSDYTSLYGNNNTCLHDAVLLCSTFAEELTELLIENGACPDTKNSNGISAPALYFLHKLPIAARGFNWVSKTNRMSLRHKLLEFIAFIMTSYPKSTLVALNGMNLYVPLKNHPGLLNYTSKKWDYDTLLHQAAESHSLEVVQWMLEHKANPNVLTPSDEKPIHYAVERLMNPEQKNLDECIEIIAHLLLSGLKRSSSKKKSLQASHLVDELMELDIPGEEYKAKIALVAFRLNYFQPLSFTEKDLLLLLDRKITALFRKDIVIDSKLGEGAFGKVYQGFRQVEKGQIEVLAIKFNKERPDLRMRQESALLSKLKHPNIISFICNIERESFGFVMKYAYGGNLDQFLKKSAVPLANEYLYSFSLQINAGLNYLHNNGYVHLDLKPENILLEGSNKQPDTRLLLTDFGAAAKIGQNKGYAVTTAIYCSPEGFNYDYPYDIAHDTFSFAVCLGYMDTRAEPWSEIQKCNSEKLTQLVAEQLEENKRTTFGNRKMRPQVAALVSWCWEQQPQNRPSHEHIEDYITCVFKPSL